MPINKTLKDAIDSIKFTGKLKQSDIADKLGVKSTYLSDMINGRVPLSDNIKDKIYELFSYKIEDTPSMLSEKTMYYGGSEYIEEKGELYNKKKKLIPFYDDVTSIGGIDQLTANMDSASSPTEYIDAGDWFRDATAAIRHYGESMVEYPSGCILALKEVQDRELIVPGRDYVVETSEYRVTKRLQKGKEIGYITAYSTNQETYNDGRLIHEPFDIPMRAISHIYLVLGYVVKKNGGSMLFSNQNMK